ncbi:hypothetical protein CpVVM_17 [Chrysochromulina parva virophage Moe]|nr:hypothetical protein CpVVM_17 [Chrysochromulina parva virophage Moe]
MNYATLGAAFGSSELTYSEYTPRQSTNELNLKNNNVRDPIEGLNDLIGKLPRDLNDVVSARNSAKQALNLDFDPSRRFSRPEASKTAGMYPQQGYARNQPMGLAFDPQHPLNEKIMPIAGYYDTNRNNMFGNLL